MHDETKRALNKAINLANLLLEEITHENLGVKKGEDRLLNSQFKEMLSSRQRVYESVISGQELMQTPQQEFRELSPNP